MRPGTLKLLKKNTGKTPRVIGRDKGFLNRTPAAQEIILKPDKCAYMELKSFYTAEELSLE